jgi:hypothetical protein
MDCCFNSAPSTGAGFVTGESCAVGVAAPTVILAKAGIQYVESVEMRHWTPAFAGVTEWRKAVIVKSPTLGLNPAPTRRMPQ